MYMKIVYALAAASIMAGGAFSNAADLKVNRNIADLNVSASEKMCAAPGSENVAPRVETRADEWKSLGEGSFREFIFSSLYRGVDAYELPVEIEQSTTDPSSYRLVNLYQEYVTEMFQGQMYTYDATSPTYLYINTVEINGNTYWYMPEDANLGFYVEPSSNGLTPGNATLHYNLSSVIAEVGAERVFEVYPDVFGKVNNGVFTVGSKFMTEDGEYAVMYWSTSGMEAGWGVGCNTKGQFAVALPGVELPAPPDPFGSYVLVGECEMQNYFLDNLFQEWTTPAGKVEVYEEENNKGYFHIKNAYVAGGWNNPEIAAVTDLEINLTNPDLGKMPEQDTGYVDDVTNWGAVEVMSASMAYTAYVAPSQQVTDEQFLTDPQFAGMNIYIDKTNKRIVIPGNAIRYYFPELPETSDMYNMMIGPGEGAKESWIQLPADYKLPDNSGINNVEVEDSNAPVKYFNLQGMEVATPEAGQLVIMKKGTKASKFIAK